MFRLSGIMAVMLATVCGALLFWTSQSVQKTEKKVNELSNYAQNEEETLRVLSAEWDYLNRPERLEELSYKNLNINQAYSEKDVFVEAVAEIPEPFMPIIPAIKPQAPAAFVSFEETKNKATPSRPQEKLSHIRPVVMPENKQTFEDFLNDVTTAAGGE